MMRKTLKRMNVDKENEGGTVCFFGLGACSFRAP